MALELQDIRKRYGPVEALRGVSGVIEGTKIGLLGPNGAGKSTLIKLLLGLTPFEGQARVLGLDPRTEPAAIRDRVGYMPETESYLAGMNAVELCVYAGELSGLPRGAAMQRAHAVLYLCGLEDKRYLKVDGYSTGMLQRVKLAQALVHDPELLFLDEPQSGLDPAGREEMLALIAALPARAGCSVVLSSHLLPDIERVCDQVVVMHEGRILFVGSIDELRGGDASAYSVRVKDGPDRPSERLAGRLRAAGCEVSFTDGELEVRAGGELVDAIWRAAREEGVQVRHLAPKRASLEAAFLRTIQGTP